MMPLTMLNMGDSASIKKVGGKEETRSFLGELGFVAGEEVRIVSSSGGNVIVQVKDSRVAISKSIANKIMV
ncbi:ferrous iron transport protein A [Aequitasia blattaphilus]|uniref:Ferrous iron transport protein A n=1 Tax=Aequitasia blattaphilus TaxID=2949332 RepID=A0ABT1EC18_9FIRM|nr:FeoA family protein [Aequitasia blattaphilus]MCP1102052.1 ferrous iron transport protein A [Aequitasia blattaphilus]MCR8614692.1 ferrous iron transport protein A [Aequitasia blattaphilus]